MRAASGPERIDERLRALYGGVPREVRVLHVASVWLRPDGAQYVLRIGPETPRSETDAFALSLARARVDAIVTTGRILREEPQLTHALLGSAQQRADLREWRAQRLSRRAPARSAVLTSGRDLDLDHPLLREATRPLLLASPGAAARLADAAAHRGIQVLGLEPLDLRTALAALEARGSRSIGVEAGPRTALSLYADPLAVDELMLSVYEAPELPSGVQGAPFPASARLAEWLPWCSPPSRAGAWRFERRTRAAPRSGE